MSMLLRRAMMGGGIVVYATLDPLNKGIDLALSGGELSFSTAYNAGLYHSVRATIGKTSGKWCWGVQYTATGTGGVPPMIGIATASNPMASVDGFCYPAPSAGHGIGWYGGTGIVYSDGVNIGNFGTFSLADTIGLLLDATTRVVNVLKNNVSVGSFPAIGGTDAIYPAVGYSGQGTANFGATTIPFTVPAGYNPGLF